MPLDRPFTLAAADASGNELDLQAELLGSDAKAFVARPALLTSPMNMVFNEATWDRQRGNTAVQQANSAARTANLVCPTQTNVNARGVHVVLDITAASGTGGLTLVIEGFDVTSGKWYTILQSAAQIAIAIVVLKVYPGVTAAANVAASDILPRTWRVRVVHGDASSYTYSVGANLVV